MADIPSNLLPFVQTSEGTGDGSSPAPAPAPATPPAPQNTPASSGPGGFINSIPSKVGGFFSGLFGGKKAQSTTPTPGSGSIPSNLQEYVNSAPASDPTSVKYANVIKNNEGGDYTAKGASGEYGAYQWLPDTWNAEAAAAGVKVPLEDATPQQQDMVAQAAIKSKVDQGWTLPEILSWWNSGDPKAYLTATPGVNKEGVPYDVKGYVDKGMAFYSGKTTNDPVPSAGIPDNMKQFITTHDDASTTPAASSTDATTTDTSSPFGNLFASSGQQNPFQVSDSTSPTPTMPDPIISLLQGLPRDAATIGVSAGQAIANLISKKAGYAAAGAEIPTSDFGGELGRIVLGSDPITGLADQAVSYESAIKASPLAQKYGLDQHATLLGVLGAVVPVGLDFIGFGGEDGAIKALEAAKTAEDAAGVLRQLGIHEDLIPKLAEDFAGMTDEGEIKSSLKAVDALNKAMTTVKPTDTETSVHDVPPASDLVPKDEGAAAADAATKEEPKPEAPASETVPKDTSAPKAPRPIEQIEADLEDWTMQRSFLSDVVHDHPGRALMKYRSNETGDLPEIKGRDKSSASDTRGKFNKAGDTILQDMLGQDESGGGDIDVGNQKLSEYVSIRDQFREADSQVRALKQELRQANEASKLQEAEQRARAAADKQNRNSVVPPPRKMTKAERAEGTPGDYLRRGAEVVRKGKGSPIRDNAARGIARDSWQKAAVSETLYGDVESGPFKGWSSRLKNWFQDWVYARQAVPEEVRVALKQFEVLKTAGQDWMFEYLGRGIKDGRVVEGSRSRYGMFGQTERLLNKWLDQEQAAGIRVAEKDNYLPIYLKNAAAESEDQLNGRRLGIRPGFSLQSEFKDYVEAIEAGYTPEYDNMYDILRARARAHYKALADANMFRTGVGEGWIIPKPAVSEELRNEFRDLSSERFPTQTAVYGNTIYNGVYDAPERVAEKVNNYLAEPDKFLKKASGIAQTVKNTALSVGIPYTGLSIHFWNVLPREVAADFATSPIRAPFETAKYFYYAINPRAAQRFIDANLEEAMPLIRAGMKISTEEHEPFKILLDHFDEKSTVGKVGAGYKAMSEWLHKVFGGNTFDKLLPARKIGNGMKLMKSYVKHGYSADEAARAAADDMNVVYGGINWESLGRNRTWQGALRSTMMAPDFAESNLKMGSRLIKAFTNPNSMQGRVYRSMMYFYLGSYMVANLMNYENSGHWMPNNDILHQFSIDLGKDTNGKERYFNIYGTGVDFLRIPLYVATAIAKGNLQDLQSVILNRLSIPLRGAMSMLLNVDWKGDPILGPDKFGRPQSAGQEAANVESNTIGNILPGSLSNLGGLVAGTVTPQEAALESAGIPITDKSISPNTADINQLKADAATGIQNGDYTLFNLLVRDKVISSRSRATFIHDALTGGKTAAQTRSSAKAKAKLKEEEQLLESQGFTTAQ